METSLPETVAKKKRFLPQWMLASTNQQHAHTTTTSSHKKQKRRDIIDTFYGPPAMKRRVPLQDVINNKKRCIDYLKEKQNEHRAKECQEDKAKRLRKMQEYAQRARSITNESADHREECLSDQRHRNQQRISTESMAQREERLLDLRERDHERRASESEEQRAQHNQIMREYRRELLANQPPPASSPESVRQQHLSRKDLTKFKK
uniref:Uncharacterized protein n=1 Tax=Amphimedon queenslandica TaxID=400682 RepID=A0A1X7VYF1_AMPQE